MRTSQRQPQRRPPVRVHAAPEELNHGDQMAFTLWFGPVPIYWRASIQNASLNGFEDQQIDGPFRKWTHYHRFNALDENTTEVSDEVHLQLETKMPSLLIGLGMLLGMPFLFSYRASKTRQLVEAEAKESDANLTRADLRRS